MPSEAPLRCRCGAVRGTLADAGPTTGNRLRCYCDDCQAFARFLGAEGVMDAAGGSDIYQTAPSNVRITTGADRLGCVRLSDKGMFRWYAGCCRTPVGNMLGPRFPFIGVLAPFIDLAASGRTLDEILGPSRGGLWGKRAIGGCPPGVAPAGSPRLILRPVRMMLGAWIRGKGHPQPFFAARTRAPVGPVTVLNADERGKLAYIDNPPSTSIVRPLK